MSLLSTYSSANKVDQTALAIRYSVAYVDTESSAYYRVTRTATRRYSYTGMTHATAITCADAKLAQYTRTYYSLKSETDPTVIGRTAVGATVSTSHGTGDSWNVDISVDETDVRQSSTAPTDPSTLFSAENARTYDDDFGAYTLTISGGGGSGTVSSTIPDFVPSRCVVQGKQSAQDEWSTIAATWTGSTFSYSGSYAYIRVIYGDYDSNTI